MGNNQKIKIKHKGWWIAALIAVFLVVIGYGAATVYLNYINIKEIGEQYLSIYIKNVQADINSVTCGKTLWSQSVSNETIMLAEHSYNITSGGPSRRKRWTSSKLRMV